MDTYQYDVVIVGAGLSGVDAACHRATESPTDTLATRILARMDELSRKHVSSKLDGAADGEADGAIGQVGT